MSKPDLDPDPDLGPGIDLDIDVRDSRWEKDMPDIWALCSRAAQETIRSVAPDMDSPEASLVLANDDFVAALNQEYRHRGGPTNVLSFAFFASLDDVKNLPEGVPALLGDVIIAYDTVSRESEDLGRTPKHHLQHLVVHGVLHLLGFDHISDEQAAIMESLETRVLGILGVPDPHDVDRGHV